MAIGSRCSAPNTAEILEAHFGVPWSGGVLVAVNTRLMADEIDYILGHSGRDAADRRPLPGPPGRGAGVRTILAGDPYEQLLASARRGRPRAAACHEDDTISINYTSGTTGRPKGVMYTHRGAYLNALAEMHHARLDCSPSTCGRCPCSTATAGASPGR